MQRATFKSHDPRMVRLVAYLRTHLDEPLELEALARLASQVSQSKGLNRSGRGNFLPSG